MYFSLQSTLLSCSEFEQDDLLKGLFVTEKLFPFRDRLPSAKNKRERVDKYIEFLINARNLKGEGVLLADFLEVLESRYHEDDNLHNEIQKIILYIRGTDDKQLKMNSQSPREYLYEAISAERFYGRKKELNEIKSWISNGCRAIAILGMGGVGKTSFTYQIVDQIKFQYDYVFWKDLRNAPLLDTVLGECIKFISDQLVIDLPDDVGGKLQILMKYVSKKRCLIVLDNVETIMQGEEQAGDYKQNYLDYRDLIQQVAFNSSQSCLLITSREKPKEFIRPGGKSSFIKSFQLSGLDESASIEILHEYDLEGSEFGWRNLVNFYGSNPLALKLVSITIEDWYEGSIDKFLEDNEIVFGDIEDLLNQQLLRLPLQFKEIMFWLAISREIVSLSRLETEIVYWLTVNREAVSTKEMGGQIVRPITRHELVVTLESLQRRSLIEKNKNYIALQPVVMEYLTKQFVKQVSDEIVNEKPIMLFSHALVQAQAKEYILQSQINFILLPILDQLEQLFSRVGVESQLEKILEIIRLKPTVFHGYAGGNILNLLIGFKSDLSKYDFSNITIWQANLKSSNLHNVNFSNSDLTGSVFASTFEKIISVAYSPDGTLVAAGSAIGDISLWDTIHNNEKLVLKGHNDWIRSVNFSPDSKMLASGSGDHTIKLWDTTTGECINTLSGHTDWVRSVAFHPDGKIIASSSSDRTIRLWDLQTGKQLKILTGHQDWVWSISFNKDGNTLASGSNDKTIKIWDIETGLEVISLNGHNDWIRTVAFSPDGKMIASGCNDNVVRLWDVSTGELIKSLSGHNDKIWCVQFSSDGEFLASSSNDNTIRLWDPISGYCLNTLQGHTGGVISISINPDCTEIVSGSEDQSIRIWDSKTGQCLRTFQGHTNTIKSIVFTPDNKNLISGSFDKVIRFWDLKSGECLKSYYGHTNRVKAVAVSIEDDILASGSDDLTIRLWDIKSGQPKKVLRGHIDWITSLAFSPDGKLLASGANDKLIKVWDVETGQCIKSLDGHISWGVFAVFSPDNSKIASASSDLSVRLWDVASGECLKIMKGHTLRINTIAYSPKNDLIVTGSDDLTVRLWDVAKGECVKIFSGHKGIIESVAFSQDGRCVISAGDDGEIRIWDVAEENNLTTLKGHDGRIWSIAVSPDGNLLASGGVDETIKVWSFQSKECIYSLHNKKIYDGLNITGVLGLTDVQKNNLILLGAISNDKS
jgi:WD40 repeat protein